MTNMTGEMGTEISTEVSGNDSRSLPYYVSWKSPPLAWTCLVSRARLENNEAPDTANIRWVSIVRRPKNMADLKLGV